MIIHRMDQRSEEWNAVRRGIPTSSNAGKIITPVNGDLSTQCKPYIAHLIAERKGMAGSRAFYSKDVEEGIEREPEARDFFIFDQGYDVEEVGFITNDAGTAGCSPDGIFEKDGEQWGLEIKDPIATTHILWMMNGGVPKDHKPQVHFSMAVTEMNWCFLSYVPGLEPIIEWVHRDEYTKAVAKALDQFIILLEAEAQQFGLAA